MSQVECQALLLSSYASNQGKTTITASFAHQLRRQGKRVRVFKVGPDYLDPKILERASGNPVYQLDLWMVGEDECRRLLYEAAGSADVILVEGVMGLFDGNPSSADLAACFGLPVAGILNAGSMAQSLHAVAYGLANYDSRLDYVGTVANCVASEKHGRMILEATAAGNGKKMPAYLGAIMRSEKVAIPSRHLGLADACELKNLDALLEAGADLTEATGLSDALRPVRFEAPRLSHMNEKSLSGIRLAIARDHAFSFLYQANLDWLKTMGAELSYFSPITDSVLPVCDAVYLPGGYPELHLAELSANSSMKGSLLFHVEADKPLYAECGGLLYLLDELTDASGNSGAMAGVIKGKARLGKKLARLGYQQYDLEQGPVRGHTFHYSHSEVSLEPIARACHPASAAIKDGEAMYRQGSVTASYVHLYFPSNPNLVCTFFSKIAKCSVP